MITISTDLLAALAAWTVPAEDNIRMPMQCIVFRNNEVIACNGKVVARVPLDTDERTLGIHRSYALAAVAAQDAWVHDDKTIAKRRRSGRSIGIVPLENGTGIMLLLAPPDHPSMLPLAMRTSPILHVPAGDIAGYPPIDQVMPSRRPEGNPAASFNLELLDGMRAIVEAAGRQPPWVAITAWGEGRDPVLFEGAGGCRFVVMPMTRALDDE